jgi:hypothetical protein
VQEYPNNMNYAKKSQPKNMNSRLNHVVKEDINNLENESESKTNKRDMFKKRSRETDSSKE